MKTVLFHFYFLLALSAFAQPINYQGRLSDKSGTNVNGTKNFSLRIFDAKTGGKQIYEENVGAVTVNEGAYSFNFGENGKSVVTPTETIACADGEKQIFNYTVKNTPVLGEIKISGGGYSWTESGSSDAPKFTATANKNSGAVSAIFLTGAPEAGENVSISYDHNSDGVMGALSRGGQAWLEISVGGETLSPRERLVAVPFALRAGVAGNLSKDLKAILAAFPQYMFGSSLGRENLFHEAWVTNPHYRNISALNQMQFYVPDGIRKLVIRADINDYTIIYKDQTSSPHNAKDEWDPIMKFKLNDQEMKKQSENKFTYENPNSGWYELNLLFPGLRNEAKHRDLNGHISISVVGIQK